MYNNPYYYNNNTQASIDRLDAQIRDLENMRNQLKVTIPQQPTGVAEHLQKQIDEIKERMNKYEQYVNANNVREIKNGEPTGVSDYTTTVTEQR